MEVRGPGPGPQQAHWARVGGGNARRIPPILEGPTPLASLLLPPLLPSYAPRTPAARGGLREWRTRPGSPAGILGFEGNSCHASPGPPVLEGSPSIRLSSFAPPHLPPMPLGPMRPGGGLGGWSNECGSPAGFPGPDWAGEMLGVLPPILQAPRGPSRHGNPYPLPATPQGHRSCLVSTSPPPSVPPHPTGSLCGSSRLLGHQGPPPVAGRLPSSCGETLTWCPPTPPSLVIRFK